MEQLATLMPLSPSHTFPAVQLEPDRRYRLSRFAFARREGDELVLESPLSPARVLLHDERAAALVAALAGPTCCADAGTKVAGLPAEAANELMTLLLQAQMLVELNDHGHAREDDDAALRCWEFHDLLFHSRSRAGRHDLPRGGTYRFAGQFDPPPALKPVPPGEAVPLFVPDLDRLEREDRSFTAVQEARHSIREYGDPPVTEQQLGEFLYRVGRIADYWSNAMPTPAGSVLMDFALRPYPAGGALYELELYVVVNRCANRAAGFYYYDPQQHRLIRLSGVTADVQHLLNDAAWSATIPAERLQVLIVLAARFPRIAWKYSSLAYALTLKHVGVLYQTMYLVATAMGLAPCGIGGGDSDAFARAAGTDYFTETSVGEFLLGSRQQGPYPSS